MKKKFKELLIDDLIYIISKSDGIEAKSISSISKDIDRHVIKIDFMYGFPCTILTVYVEEDVSSTANNNYGWYTADTYNLEKSKEELHKHGIIGITTNYEDAKEIYNAHKNHFIDELSREIILKAKKLKRMSRKKDALHRLYACLTVDQFITDTDRHDLIEDVKAYRTYKMTGKYGK